MAGAAVDSVLTSEADGLSAIYNLKAELGGAQIGCIEAVHRKTGVRYALRRFTTGELERGRKLEELTEAIAAQQRLRDAPTDLGDEVRCARIAVLHEVLQSPEGLLLVSELCPPGDDLLSMLQQRGRLAEPDARRIFARMVLAAKRAHECGAVLRNIKPETVHVRREDGGEYEVWLTELHCAARVPLPVSDDGTLSGLHGTPEYAAPEVAIWYWHESAPPRLPEPPPRYGAKCDVWALGMCLHVMLCGCFPFATDGVGVEELMRAINVADFAFDDPGWASVSEAALELVGLLLAREPADRPYLEEVLQHPFCAEAVQECMTAERAGSLGGQGDAAYDAALAALDDGSDDD